MRYLCWESLVGFTEAVFCSIPFSQNPPDGVNRHLVQHGRAMPPRPQVDCLRLLQALETLSVVADEEEMAAADPEPAAESFVNEGANEKESPRSQVLAPWPAGFFRVWYGSPATTY
jgi:hypothetical protein